MCDGNSNNLKRATIFASTFEEFHAIKNIKTATAIILKLEWMPAALNPSRETRM